MAPQTVYVPEEAQTLSRLLWSGTAIKEAARVAGLTLDRAYLLSRRHSLPRNAPLAPRTQRQIVEALRYLPLSVVSKMFSQSPCRIRALVDPRHTLHEDPTTEATHEGPPPIAV